MIWRSSWDLSNVETDLYKSINAGLAERLLRGFHKMECYKCAECGNWYKDKSLAAKCRAWCKKNPSCNPSLKKQAIKKENVPVKKGNKQGVGIDGCTYC